MKRIEIIQPSQDLIETVAEHLVPGEADYSKNLVVFPGRRPAHFLRKAIATVEGRPFIPPEVLSIEEFVAKIARPDGGHAIQTLDALDAVGMLFSIHTNQQTRLGGDHFTDLERFFPLGEKLFNELEEMKMAMCDPAEVREQTSVVEYANGYIMAELYESFYRTVEREGRMTRAMTYAHAARDINADQLAGYDRVIFGGLYALTPSEQMLLTSLQEYEHVRIVFIAGPGLKKHLESLGIDDEATSTDSGGPTYDFVRAPDLHGQIGALSAHISDVGPASVQSERNVLVLPKPDALFPVVNHVLPMFPENGYNISMGYPLARTPLSGLFQSLSEAAERKEGERWFAPDYLRVMLHPYIKSVRFKDRSDVTRILIHTIEEWLSESAGFGLRTLQEIQESDDLFTRAVLRMDDEEITADDLRMHLKELHGILFSAWSDSATLRDFVESCKNVVRFIHDRTTAVRHPYFSSFSDTMMDGLRLLGESMLGSQRMGSVRGSFALFGHIMRTQTIPFPGSPLHGFQVLGLLETRGLSFDNVYIVEANDDVLPGSSGSDNLLPETVRRKLNMETRQEREQIMDYYVSVLFAGAKHVWISWDDAEGKEKSRFVERLLWEKERADKELMDQETIPLVRYGLVLEPHTPDPIEKTDMDTSAIARRSLSAGALDSYLRCQVRFYYSYVLGLTSPDNVSGTVEHAEIGNLVHDVLFTFLGPWKDRSLDHTKLDPDAARQAAEAAFDERFGMPTSATSVLMRERIAEQVGRFIADYQRPMAEQTEIRIVSLEETITGNIGGTRFRVRTDRVEERKADHGALPHILDYKTSGNESAYMIDHDALDPEDRSTWYSAIGSFQLFLYSVLYAQNRTVDPEHLSAAFLFLGKQSIDPSIEVGLFDPEEEDKGSKLQRLHGVVTTLCDEMRDPKVAFAPTEYPEHECPRCPFTSICGTAWTQRRGRW